MISKTIGFRGTLFSDTPNLNPIEDHALEVVNLFAQRVCVSLPTSIAVAKREFGVWRPGQAPPVSYLFRNSVNWVRQGVTVS